VKQVLALGNHIEGITVSGGEPLTQVAALTDLLRRIKEEMDLGTIVFTGYTWQEARTVLGPGHSVMQQRKAGRLCPGHGPLLLDYVDLLIAGRYDHRQRVAQSLCGSANKTLHFLTQRYAAASLTRVPPTEIILNPDGCVVQSGIMPLTLEHTLKSPER
jgi:anaerobic ribonucleoside-triphosphate reductase activating protein